MGDTVVRIFSVIAMIVSAVTFGFQIGPVETTLAAIFFVFSLAILLSVGMEGESNVERD